MKLLIITQKVDKEDPVLGFFHDWILELSKKFEKISVICLEKGKYNLPDNVKIFSLGKESGKSKIKYVKNFFNLILGLHKEYDAVFAHMNQEYILLGGLIWRILRKKIYFWRNHRYGNLLTIIAVCLSNRVFCTSPQSFTAKYKKTSLMPAGIDTNLFRNLNSKRIKNSILFLGRMSPIKRPELLLEALDMLNEKDVDFVCDFYGNPKLKVKKVNKINFHNPVSNYETPKIYNEHEIFVNLTPTGSFDKTILEAAACGCMLVVANKSLVGEIDERMIIKEETPNNIAEIINFWLNINEEERKKASEELRKYVLENHSLKILISKLADVME
jgi:glycosyltransferase involved in cell wall biosynthesis